MAQPGEAGQQPILMPSDAPPREPKRDAFGRSYATGRRKESVARVWIKPGKGEITVEGAAKDVFVELTPGLKVDTTGGVQRIPVIWNTSKPCGG